MVRIVGMATVLLSALFTMTACGGGSCSTLGNSDGDQSDYDAAYAGCFDDGQADVCAGAAQATSYDTTPYDVCDDNLSDQGTRGCEAGYIDGFAACQ